MVPIRFVVELLSFHSIPKVGESAESNADRIIFRGRLAGIADGVSQSHQPGRWAEVVLKVVSTSIGRSPNENDFEHLATSGPDNLSSVESSGTPWYAKKLLEKGGQTTALWCEVSQRSGLLSRFKRELTVNLRSLGDCLIFLIKKDSSVVKAWPFPIDGDYPEVDGAFAEKSPHIRGNLRAETVRASPQTLLLFVTDALGRYLHSTLSAHSDEGKSEFESFLGMIVEEGDSKEKFAKWVHDRRAIDLEDDDTTYMLVRL